MDETSQGIINELGTELANRLIQLASVTTQLGIAQREAGKLQQRIAELESAVPVPTEDAKGKK